MTPEERLHGFLNALETAMDKYDVRPVASFTLTSGPVLEVETVPQREFLASLKTSDGGVKVIATKTGVNTGSCTKTANCQRHNGHGGGCTWRLG